MIIRLIESVHINGLCVCVCVCVCVCDYMGRVLQRVQTQMMSVCI